MPELNVPTEVKSTVPAADVKQSGRLKVVLETDVTAIVFVEKTFPVIVTLSTRLVPAVAIGLVLTAVEDVTTSLI